MSNNRFRLICLFRVGRSTLQIKQVAEASSGQIPQLTLDKLCLIIIDKYKRINAQNQILSVMIKSCLLVKIVGLWMVNMLEQ